MTNHIERARYPVARHRLPMAASRPARALARSLASLAAWARLGNGVLRIGDADVATPLDPRSRALLWSILTETISTVAVLAAPEVRPEAGLGALRVLGDRVREQVALGAPPPGQSLGGAEPPQIFALEILTHDIQPCIDRWLPRLDLWRETGRANDDWPLTRLCRADLARTRERLVERSWQIGIALRVPGLDRIVPDRPATVPVLAAADDIAAAEAAMIKPSSPALLQAGWRIYVEAMAGIPACDPGLGPGAIHGAFAALDALAAEIRAELKAMPPPRGSGAADTIRALVFGMLTEELQPFLAEWRPRYQRFAASERSEAKWRRAEECRAALAATRERCLPKIRALGVEVGAPLLAERPSIAAGNEEAPLQLPPPETRS